MPGRVKCLILGLDLFRSDRPVRRLLDHVGPDATPPGPPQSQAGPRPLGCRVPPSPAAPRVLWALMKVFPLLAPAFHLPPNEVGYRGEVKRLGRSAWAWSLLRKVGSGDEESRRGSLKSSVPLPLRCRRRALVLFGAKDSRRLVRLLWRHFPESSVPKGLGLGQKQEQREG